MKGPIVVQTEHLSPAAAEWLRMKCELKVCAPEENGFFDLISQAVGLVVRTYTIVDKSLLDRAPNLKVVGRAGVGLDNIDVSECRRRGVEVVYTPDANTQAVVEYVLAILLDATRPRITLQNAVPINEWNRLRAETVGVRQMNQMTLGILGFGRVGKRLAKAAHGLSMRVLYNDLIEIPEHERVGAMPVDVHTLFAESDVVSVHIDGRPSNAKFVSANLIERMKSDAIFINASRGIVIDNAALADWLIRQPNALALLDVHDPEPITPEYPLLRVSNARLYPHLASRTHQAMENMSWVVKDVVAVLQGEMPQFPAP